MEEIFMVFLAFMTFFGLTFSTFMHELFHYIVGYKYGKCDSIICLRTHFFKYSYTFRNNNGYKLNIKLVPKKQLDCFDMKDCLGKTYFSNEYRPYDNNELIRIARAGIYGSILGYIMPCMALGIMCGMVMNSSSNLLYDLFDIVITRFWVFSVSLCFFLLMYLLFVIIKIHHYYSSAKRPGWSDGAIVKDPNGYRNYLQKLSPNSACTYQGVKEYT